MSFAFLPFKQPPPDEPDPIEDDGWVPGWHPILDLLKTMSMLSRSQVQLAKSHEQLWNALITMRRAWFVMAVLWVITSLLSSAPTVMRLLQ